VYREILKKEAKNKKIDVLKEENEKEQIK